MNDMMPFNGLRGVCAMAIFLGHQADMFLSPAIGLEYLQAVSLFFLLSGIPLVRLYTTTGKVTTWNGTILFWKKRLARLIPIYYLTLLLNLAVVYIICQQVDVTATIQSFVGCALFLQSWFVSLINIGGVLWQVAVFMFGYAIFPVVSQHISEWNLRWLYWGIAVLWLVSLGLWFAFAEMYPQRSMGWWVWHVHCLSRLPQFIAGVLLGQLVEKKRNNHEDRVFWAITTDVLSLVLLVTAIQAPIVQYYYGTDVRSAISIALEAWLLPLHATWLCGMILAYHEKDDIESQHPVSSDRQCWTRRVLSFQPLVALGNVSLVLYCLHLVVLFLYTSIYAYVTTGDRHIAPSIFDYTLSVQNSWWHAPIQWILVIGISFAVSKWFEAPLRLILSGSSQRAVGDAQQDASEQTRLIPSGSDEPVYSSDK